MDLIITDTAPSAAELTDLYLQAEFIAQAEPNKMTRIMQSSCQWTTVRSNAGSLLGIGRVITDYARYGFIVDVIIHQSHQRKGIGTIIMNAIIKQCMALELDALHLWPTKGKAPFYQHFGFEKLADDQPHMKLTLDNYHGGAT